MFNVCPNCGMYQVDKKIAIQNNQNIAICKHCQHPHPFNKLPLLFLTGASGAGKSTIGLRLQQTYQKVVVLENDILPFDKMPIYELGLRIAKNLHQNGKSVLQVGCNIPGHLEQSIEKRYFDGLHYLALVCDSDLLIERLKARPAWRGCDNDSYWKPQVEFNEWFKNYHDKVTPNIDLIDTTDLAIADTEQLLKDWIEQKLK